MNYMRKTLLTFLAVGLLWAGVSYAQTNPATSITPGVNTNNTILKKCDSNKCYELLEVLPSADNTLPPLESIDTTSSGSDGIGGFINFIFQIGLGVAGVIGVVMLTVYGFQYAANDKNVQTFAQLKEKILGVVMGLLLLLGIFVILKTINPDLLIVEPDINVLTYSVNDAAYEGDLNDNTIQSGKYVPPGATLKQKISQMGIYCPGTGGPAVVSRVAESFKDKVTYRYGGKGTNTKFSGEDSNNPCPSNNTFCIDCSGYINIVHMCAGIPAQGGGTTDIFTKPDAERITQFNDSGPVVIVNGTALKPGDLIGGPNWHVLIYMGNGIFSDSSSDIGGRGLNKMVRYGKGFITVYSKRKQLYVNRI